MGARFQRILRAALALAAVCAAARAETLRLATWNVRNYTCCDRRTDDGFRSVYPKPEAEKQALRAVLRAIRPDVLALQEMGPRPYLEELRRDLKAEGLDYPYAAQVQGPDPERCVAILSRIPFARVREHAQVPTATGEDVCRGLLEADFTVNGATWTLFVVHLKSRRTTDPKDPDAAAQRLAEARAVWAVVKACGTPDVVVAGDFNDNAVSAAVRAFTGSGKKADGRVRALAAADTRGEIWTHYYAAGETYDRFDLLLCSPAMAARVVGGAGRVGDAAQVPQASDHRPVWADFAF